MNVVTLKYALSAETLCHLSVPEAELAPTLEALGFEGEVLLVASGVSEETIEAFTGHCEDLLSDMTRETTTRLLNAKGPLSDLGSIRLMKPFAEVLASQGVNPVVLCALTHLGQLDYLIENGPLAGSTMTTDADGLNQGQPAHTVTLSSPDDEIVWDATWAIMRLDKALPATVMPHLAGRNLRDVVSSPLTDLIEATIRDAETGGGGTVITLSHDQHRDAIPLREMVGAIL